MDAQLAINILAGVCLFAGGYILNSLKKSVDDLTTKVQHVEVLVAGHYVSRPDFEKVCDKLYEKLDKIDAKLDGKVDK